MRRYFIRRRVPYGEGQRLNRLQEAMNARQRRAADWMQKRSMQLSRRMLAIALVAFGILGLLACVYCIYRSITGANAWHFIFPIRSPVIINDEMPVRHLPIDSIPIHHK
jgi:hypothetical protein